MAAFLSVLSSLLVGIVLAFIPWINVAGVNVWENNYLLQTHPLLRGLLLSAFTRGAVTGLGLVNLMMALLEARDHVRELREGGRDV
jgi:hypothetical protein